LCIDVLSLLAVTVSGAAVPAVTMGATADLTVVATRPDDTITARRAATEPSVNPRGAVVFLERSIRQEKRRE